MNPPDRVAGSAKIFQVQQLKEGNSHPTKHYIDRIKYTQTHRDSL